MDIRNILRMATEMADASNKAKEQFEKRRDAIVKAARGGADREELRKLLDEHYKKVDESLDIGTKKKVMKEVMKDSDTVTDSAFTQAITVLKEANEKMDEFSKEIQLDFLCDMSGPEAGTYELFALLGFVQASCDYSEFMFRCIYETLTERIEKLRKENEEKHPKYKDKVEMSGGHLLVPKCFGEYLDEESKQCKNIDCEYRMLCRKNYESTAENIYL